MALRPPPFFCFGEEHLTASLRTQQAHAPVPPLHHLWCLRPARPRACARESNPCEKEARLFGPALCQLLSNPAEEPTQASTNRHSHASLQSTSQPRDLHMTHIASRTARACLGTAQHLFVFWCFTPARTWARRRAYWNEDGIISGHSSPINQIISGHTSPFCRGFTDLVLICGKSHAVLRATSSDYGSWSNWAYYSFDSRGLCLGHSVLPLPCENRRLSMGFSHEIILFFQFKHTDGLYEACILLVLLQVGMTGYLSLLVVQRAQHAAPPVGEFSLPVVQRVQHAAPPVGESFSPGTTELNFQPHQSAIRSSLQQNAQTFFTQQRSRTY